MINRREVIRATGAALAVAAAHGCVGSAETRPSTTAEVGWLKADLAADRRKLLEAAVQHALGDTTAGMLVVQDGRIAAEGYAQGLGPASRSQLASAAKSIVALVVGIAIDRGHIRSVEQSAADFIPAWRGTQKEAVHIRHLLSMTSGMTDDGLRGRNVPGDQFRINAAAPLHHVPGTHWQYASAIYHLLFHIVAEATGLPFETFARTVLLEPIGMNSFEWVTERVETEHGPRTNYYTGACSARDLARIGLLVANRGESHGRRILSPGYLGACLTVSQRHNPSYGWLWWLNLEPGHATRPGPQAYRFPGAPRDTVAALGARGQALIIVPSEGLIVVRQGQEPSDPELVNALLEQVLQALT